MRGAWEQALLGDLCAIDTGASDTKDAVVEGPFAFFDRSKTPKRSARYLFDTEAIIIPGEGTEFLPRHFVGKFDLHQRAYALHGFRSTIIPMFLYHFLHARSSYWSEVAVGATVKSLRRRHFESLHVPVPPIHEQQRIVSLLTDAFEGVAAAIKAAERSRDNALTLFCQTLDFVLGPAPGWKSARLSELGRLTTGNTPKSSSEGCYGGAIPFIKPGDFRRDGTLDYDHESLTEAGIRQSRLIPAQSALMVCIGATIGKSGFTERDVGANQQVNAFSAGSQVDARFVFHQMRTSRFQADVLRNAAQATLPIISKSKWGALQISYPDLSDQKRIVGMLDNLRKETDHLADVYTDKIALLVELRRSLLARAFSGELTREPLAA